MLKQNCWQVNLIDGPISIIINININNINAIMKCKNAHQQYIREAPPELMAL
jgi:hypothetical protein